jgi:DNA replication and repair protein RecF
MSAKAALSERVLTAASVTRLALTDFRGYAAARLALEPRPVVLTGPNGAGKTNLLEAVSFLAPGRGLRRARLREIDRRVPPARATALPPGAWAVAATVAGPRGATEIGTGRDAQSETGERRLVRIDGDFSRTQATLSEQLCVIWLTPQMDRLFTEAASARRRFLDRLVYGFDPGHAHRVGAYEQAMRERARLLTEDRQADPSWLSALEARMAEHGIAVAAARRETVARLDEEAASLPRGTFPAARLALEGEIEAWLDTVPALAAEEEFGRRLAAARRADAAAGTTTIGPHRADLAVRHGATHMQASQCSTGEQKALLIGIVLAFAQLMARRRGEVPILLLDEVAAHLDIARRESLFAEIAAARGQAWLTGTDKGLFDGMAGVAQFLTVADAVIST